MATWTYNDWITLSTPALRESRLRLHIQEVSEQMTADVTKGNASRSTGGLGTYLSELYEQLDQLMTVMGTRFSYARMGDA